MVGQIVFTGNVVKARYKEQFIPMYQHNPYIEALPPLLDAYEVASRISRRPMYSEEERKLPPLQRVQSVQTIANFIEPMSLHLDLEARFSRMIRNGYMARNPLKAEWKKQMRAGFKDLKWGEKDDDYVPIIRSSATGFAIVGASGVGKSTAIESILGLYPQVIEHTCFNGHILNERQLVWLKLNCPQDGSIKGLCLNFFQEVDRVLETKYYERFSKSKVTIDVLLPTMGELALSLGLGVLVIDEIQNLLDANAGGAKRMLNTFVQLVNIIGVPIVTVGTFRAINLLGTEFATARRASGQGDLLWHNLIEDEEWDDFIEVLWEYQWTNVPTPLTSKLKKVLYEESQGIIDLAVKLYMMAQWSVIGFEDEKETITPQLIKRVAADNFTIARPILDALKAKDTTKLKLIPDVLPTDDELAKYYRQATEKVTIFGSKNTLLNQQLASQSHQPTQNDLPPFNRIAQWLVDVGIEKTVAMECANKSLQHHGAETDIQKAMQFAYSLAFHMDLPNKGKKTDENEPSKKKKNSKTEPLVDEYEIKDILEKDKQNINDVLDI